MTQEKIQKDIFWFKHVASLLSGLEYNVVENPFNRECFDIHVITPTGENEEGTNCIDLKDVRNYLLRTIESEAKNLIK